MHRAAEAAGAVEPSVACADFVAAMDDDLAVPAALAALHDVVREGNTALAAGDHATARGAAASVRAMLGVLGVDPLAEPWASARGGSGDAGLRDAVDALVAGLARASGPPRASDKDFAAADAIRDRLTAAGIAVEDTAEGPRWSLAEEGHR